MDVKLDKGFLFVFKEFLGYEYLLIDEVYDVIDWLWMICIWFCLLSGIFWFVIYD